MKELQFTLYEVFGYLLPGAVFVGGAGALFWAAYLPQASIDLDIKSAEVWGIFLALAYVAGHVAQGMGNAVVRRFESAEDHCIRAVVPPEIVRACKAKAKELTGEDLADVSPRWLCRLCDDAVVRSGKLGEREVYVYREGFYRGTFVGMACLILGLVALGVRLLSSGPDAEGQRTALLALPAAWAVLLAGAGALAAGVLWDRGRKKSASTLAAVGLLLLGGAAWSLLPGNWSAAVWLGRMELTAGRLFFLAALGGVGAWFLWHRHWRFAEYRVTQGLLGFLTIRDDKKPEAAQSTEGR